MRTFKVIALSCSGKGKKIYSAQEVVNEDGFPEGTCDELIEKGFIEEIKPTINEDDDKLQKLAESEAKKKEKAESEAKKKAESETKKK